MQCDHLAQLARYAGVEQRRVDDHRQALTFEVTIDAQHPE